MGIGSLDEGKSVRIKMTDSVYNNDCCECEDCECGCNRLSSGEVETADAFERRLLQPPDSILRKTR